MGDKVISIGLTFLITAMLARYLGPSNFGIYSYVISLVSLFAIAGHMGLSGLVVRELVKQPNENHIILGTSLFLKLMGMAVGYLGLLTYSIVYEGYKSQEFLLISIAGLALLLRGYDVIDYWFQSHIQAKYVSISNFIGTFIYALLIIIFVYMGLGLTSFIISTLIKFITIGLMLYFFYKVKSGLSIRSWRFSGSKAKELLGESWLVYLGSLFGIINLKIDQVMIKWYQGAEQVGIYAVAAQISEAWYFIPTAIVASFFPKLIKLKESNFSLYHIRLQQLFNVLFIIALIVAIMVSVGGDKLINVFFGAEYLDSSKILVVHIWAAIFIFMRALFSKWILIEEALIFSLITQGLGAAVNVTLNYFWISKYGALGAAYATLLSYATSSFFALIFYKKTRPIFWMMFKALLILPFLKSLKNEKDYKENRSS